MRVLFFNEGNLGGHILGQERLDAALRIGLAEHPDIQARFLGLAPMARLSRAAAQRPLPLLARAKLDPRALRWHLVQSLRARAKLERELRRWPAEVVQVHSQSIALTARSVMRRVPVVLSLDTTFREWSAMPAWQDDARERLMHAPARLLERRALRAAGLVLAWTGWAARSVATEAPGATVVEHHPGLDLDRYRPAPRLARPRPRVLFVGGRFAEKGGEDLLAALAPQLGHELELDIVTQAEVRPRAGVRVHRLGSDDPQLLELLQQADAMCLPTYGDTNPWALIEAMACGTPVLSTPVGAIAELLDNGRAGVLVPHGDTRALGEALRSLLADPQRGAQLAARARSRCEQRYDARRQFAALVDLLRGVIDAPRSR